MLSLASLVLACFLAAQPAQRVSAADCGVDFTPAQPTGNAIDCGGCNFRRDANGVLYRNRNADGGLACPGCTSLPLFGFVITGFAPNVFCSLDEVVEMDLSDNAIGSIPSEPFEEMSALKTLKLHSNGMRALDSNAFDDLNELVNLTLHDNVLEPAGAGMPYGLFDDTKALENLELNDNPTLNGTQAFVSGIFANLLELTSIDMPEDSCVPTDSPQNVLVAIAANDPTLPGCIATPVSPPTDAPVPQPAASG